MHPGYEPDYSLSPESRVGIENSGRLIIQGLMPLEQIYHFGKLTKPKRCEVCGSLAHDIEAHHFDCGKPLDVQWLCLPCHDGPAASGWFGCAEA